jgi:SsrA-binding protein
MAKEKNPNSKTVAENRKARFSYEVLDTYEAGLAPRWRAARSG